jgi:hypothetical protein
MVLQQFGGVNGISFYASAIFISAGRRRIFLMVPIFDRNQKKIEVDYRNMWSMQGFLVVLGLLQWLLFRFLTLLV